MHALPDLQRWRPDINAEDAERRVAELQARIAEADEAIASQQQLIARKDPSAPFPDVLDKIRAAQRSDENELATIMERREREVLDFALDGPRYAQYRAPAKALSEVLHAVQQLYLRVGQAMSSPRPSPRVPFDVANHCQLEVAGFFPSSFGIRFTAPTRSDMDGHSLTTTALEATFELINAEQPLEEAAKVGKWALAKYRKLVHTLVEAEATPKVNWTTPAGDERQWAVDDNRLLVLANRLAHIRDMEPRTREAVGTLTGASLRRQRFEFATTGEVITGIAPKELAEKITAFFGKLCTITYIESVFIDETTDQERRSRTLVDIR